MTVVPEVTALASSLALGFLLSQADVSQIGGWQAIIALAPQAVIAVGLFFAMKFMIEQGRKDNDLRDSRQREALDKFEKALERSNLSSENQMHEIADQLQAASQQDREQNAKLFDVVLDLTRRSIDEMSTIKGRFQSLELEFRTGRRGSALPPPDGGSDPRPHP